MCLVVKPSMKAKEGMHLQEIRSWQFRFFRKKQQVRHKLLHQVEYAYQRYGLKCKEKKIGTL